jgi:hypothetical protein
MKIEQLAADLAGDKGAFKVKARADIQDRAHKQRLENAAFGLDQAEFTADLQNQRADNRRMSRKDRFDRRDKRIDNQRQGAAERRQQQNTNSLIQDRREDNARQRQADRADDGKINGSNFTPTQVRSGRRQLRSLIDAAKNAKAGDKAPSGDPLLVRAAAQIARNGGVDAGLARKIRRAYGFTPKIKRNASLTPRNPDGTPG